MKGVKRFLVFFLSCVLALSTVGLAPMAARAEEGDLRCEGFLSAYTEGYEITEELHTYEFRSKTDDDAPDNWDTPLFVVFHSEDGTATIDNQYVVIRSDNWYLDDRASKVDSTKKVTGDGLADWTTWLTENKTGVDCSVTTQLYNNYALVGVSNNGVTATYVVPINPDAKNYVALSGEKCTLSGLKTSSNHIDLSAAMKEVEKITTEPDDSGDDDSREVFLECGDFWSAHTDGFEITEETHTYVFHSKTKAGAADNWLTPMYVVFHSEDSKVNGTGYREYGVIRSDDYYWDAQGAKKDSNITQATTVLPDWGTWLAENIKGVDCTVTTQLYNGNALIGVSNGGATATYVVPVDSSIINYLSLSGQSCTLSDLQTSDQHIDLSAAKASVDAATDEPGTDEPGTDEPGTDTPGGVFLDCPGWWQAHTAGMEITEEPQTYTFHSKTYAGKMDNWNTPLFVVFSSEDGLVKEAGAAGYTEYGVIRSDHYHWGDTISETSVVYPAGFDADWDASWAAWQAANRAGVDCAVTTQLYNGYAVVGVSNNGITTTYAIKVNPAVKNYLSLTGELCTLSNLQTSDQHIDLTAAKAGADAGITPSNNSNSSNNSSAPAAPASSVRAIAGGEVLSGSAWWSGMAIGSNQPMSGDGTWSWVVQATSLIDGYGAFSVEVYDPVTNGYITTGSDMNAWTAEGFDPANAMVLGVPAELASNLVEGHAYVVTVTRSGNSFTVQYVDFTDNKEICTLTIVPGEMVSNDVVVHVMAQVGTYVTAFCEGALVDAPAGAKAAKGGEVLKGTEWWAGMMKGADRLMSGDGTWTWTVKASSLMDGYGAFSVEIYDPSTNGYITTGSDKNAWTAEGFNPDTALVTGVPKTLESKLVEGHTYAVTVTRVGNTFTVRYTDHTTGKEICTLVITPAEIVGKNVQIHVMAQVGTFVTAFNEGTLIAALGDSIPVAFYVIAVIGLAAIIFGLKKRFTR